MRLVHYSADVVTKVHGRRQYDPLKPENKTKARSDKPNGLWLSDEDRGAYGWRSWCTAERFRRFAMRYEHEIQLTPSAKILYLHSADDLQEFTRKYGYSLLDEIYKAEGRQTYSSMRGGRVTYDGIRWHELTRKYHGIVITPYIWEERLGDLMWYYGWDCASGCIWNPRAIASISVVKERKVPRKPTYWQAARKHKRQIASMTRLRDDLREITKGRAEAATVTVKLSERAEVGGVVVAATVEGQP